MLTEKNTKKEILAAYRKAVAENKRDLDSKSRARVALAESASPGSDVPEILSGLQKSWSEVVRELSDIRDAVQVKKEELHRLYEIGNYADSLDRAADAHVQAMADMEEERNEAKRKASIETSLMEEAQERRVERLRSDYIYMREEFDRSYEARTEELNRALEIKGRDHHDKMVVREQLVETSERELEELREKVGQFPKQIEQAKDQAADQARAKTLHEGQLEINELKRELTHLKQSHSIIVASLDKKIESLIEDNEYLKAMLHEANTKVGKIAETAINGAQKVQTFPGWSPPNSFTEKKVQ